MSVINRTLQVSPQHHKGALSFSRATTKALPLNLEKKRNNNLTDRIQNPDIPEAGRGAAAQGGQEAEQGLAGQDANGSVRPGNNRPLCSLRPLRRGAKCPERLFGSTNKRNHIPRYALHEKGLQRQKKRRHTGQQPGTKNGRHPANKRDTRPLSMAGFVPRSTYIRFRLFVLPMKRPGQLYSMTWRS